MLNTTTVTELRFGDFTGANVNSFPSGFSDGLGGWYARLDSMWIANGAAFDQAQVTELLDHEPNSHNPITTLTSLLTPNLMRLVLLPS